MKYLDWDHNISFSQDILKRGVGRWGSSEPALDPPLKCMSTIASENSINQVLGMRIFYTGKMFFFFHFGSDMLTPNSYNMGLITRKPVFGVSDQFIPKPACSAAETPRKLQLPL